MRSRGKNRNLEIELKMKYGSKKLGAVLKFDEQRRNTENVSKEVWLLMHSLIRTLQKENILDEAYFWGK